MALVDYSDSEEEAPASTPLAKKRRISGLNSSNGKQLPPLPASFHDLYSSTVRTSTSDDPSLHAGRKRLAPHVEGNWAAHLYLEWHPGPTETELLTDLIQTTCANLRHPTTSHRNADSIHGLLYNDLGVAAPLHVSLSRPLILRSETKDDFLEKVTRAVSESGAKAFHVQPSTLDWHPNEDRSRWFLVLRVSRPANDELTRLLKVCNDVALSFGQPLLYSDDIESTPPGIELAKKAQSASPDAASTATAAGDRCDRFHISLAWSLRPPSLEPSTYKCPDARTTPSQELWGTIISFSEIKIRIGKDVKVVKLGSMRKQSQSILG